MSPDEPEDPKPASPAPSSGGAVDDKAAAKADKEARDSAEDEAKAAAKANKEAQDKAEDEAEAAAKAEAKAKKEADKKAEHEREAKEASTRIPPAPPWYRTLRADPPIHIRLALALALIAIILGVWWFVTLGGDMMQLQFNGRTKELDIKFFPSVDRMISAVKLPSPGDTFAAWGALWDRELTHHLTQSLERVLKGIALASIVGVLLGVLAAAYRGVSAALSPLIIFLRSIPMGALIPLTLMLFGQGEAQKTRFIFLAVVAFVFSDTVKAISIVPERYVETAQTLGASRFQIIRKVLVPLALPDIITSLRFQLGLALGYIVLAEVIDADYGLGKLISLSESKGLSTHVYLLLFVIALIAFGIDLVLRTIQRGVFSWRKDL